MDKVKMQAPPNAGGFTTGGRDIKPDAAGYIYVEHADVDAAKSHGYKTVGDDGKAIAPVASDPNVKRPGGQQQAAPVPGGDLSDKKETQVAKDAATQAVLDKDKASKEAAAVEKTRQLQEARTKADNATATFKDAVTELERARDALKDAPNNKKDAAQKAVDKAEQDVKDAQQAADEADAAFEALNKD